MQIEHGSEAPKKRPALLLVAILASTAIVLWMANRAPFVRGALWGTGVALLASSAWVAWLIPPQPAQRAISWRQTQLARKPGEKISPGVSVIGATFTLLVGGKLGGFASLPVVILAALAWFVPVALRRPGLLVLLVVSALYLPGLGSYGLWDPWESHYGEVAREILARNDWISLWWAQDEWFWSKPPLLFWAEAWSMALAGVDFRPDANPTHPEWAIRLPTFAITLVALAVLYEAVRRRFGARAGALAALVTATMPLFFLISHQAITDLPLAASITVAVCCLWMALDADPERETTRYRFGRVTVSLQHLVLFVVVFAVLTQAAYLISRNISFLEGRWVMHPDRFLYGSLGNEGIPGNPEARDRLPHLGGLAGQPFIQGIVWLCGLATLMTILRRERRARPLLMACFYCACTSGFMVKGLPGLAIPGMVAFLYLIASRRWGLLRDGDLRIATGALLVASIGLPWYVAMYVRHGPAFTNRLLIHDHINRLAAGVHGDQGTIEYFLAQIGYATFPWVALFPAAVLGLLWYRSASPPIEADRQNQALLLLGVWMLSSFALFSAMVTKYHHYILPAVVPGGILVGIAAAQWWGPRKPVATMLATASAGFAVLGIAWIVGDPRGIVPANVASIGHWALRQSNPWLGSTCLTVAALLAWQARSQIDRATTATVPAKRSIAAALAAMTGACLVAFVGRDLSGTTSARPQGNERLMHLFVYNYERSWPEHFDYRAMLMGFSIATTVVVALAVFASWRAVAIRALVGLAILFCAWGLNVYVIDLSPHWGLRELAQRYYDDRQGPEEPLVAWQMNWKGENFYTGNRVHVFAELDNARIKAWLGDNQGRTAYFVLERRRYPNFKRLLAGRTIRELSTEREQNKYLLVAVEI